VYLGYLLLGWMLSPKILVLASFCNIYIGIAVRWLIQQSILSTYWYVALDL
jgi:hypothetical protein